MEGEPFGGEVNASKTDGIAKGDVRFPFDFGLMAKGNQSQEILGRFHFDVWDGFGRRAHC